MTAENGTARKERGEKGSLESEQTGTQTFKGTPHKWIPRRNQGELSFRCVGLVDGWLYGARARR